VYEPGVSHQQAVQLNRVAAVNGLHRCAEYGVWNFYMFHAAHLQAMLLHEGMKMQPSVNYFHHQNANVRITSLFLELLERQFPIDSPQYDLKLKTAKDYAEGLSVHVNHLNRAVKEVTGRTTTEHLAERIVGEAKALLLQTNWSINEIAYSLGYEYPTYFNNFFKKQTGVAPSSLRQHRIV
jgi:AraC family transcriptional activator of pobA